MKFMPRVVLMLTAILATGCQPMAWPPTRIGINQPPPGVVRALAWNAVPGASAYLVVVSLDRTGTEPVGKTGFTAETHATLPSVAWEPGHPIAGRTYFWTVLAYDRPDPTGLLLTTRGPEEITFDEADLVAPDPIASP